MSLRRKIGSGFRYGFLVSLLLLGPFRPQIPVFAQETSAPDLRRLGAIGDGRADDSESFRRALAALPAAGGRLEIPAGLYRIYAVTFPEHVTLDFRSGGGLLLPEGSEIRIEGAIEAGLVPIFSGEGSVKGEVDNLYIFPQWFGARGDGIQDDAAAVQRAADLAADALGRTLFIPEGEYLFGENVAIRSNLECRGLLVKEIEIDEAKTQFSNFTFVPDHRPKSNPQLIFAPDHEEVELDASLFYGVEEGQLRVPVFRNVPIAGGRGRVDLAEGGTLRFYSSDFFLSRKNLKGDQFYDRNDIAQIVSGRGDVFPEFAFSYPKPPLAEAWSEEAVYSKGDYVSHGGEIFKATWPSGEGTVYPDRFLGTVEIGPVQPQTGAETTLHNFVFENGANDSLSIWRRVQTRVWYRPKDRPSTVNGLRVEVRLKNHGGESKRIMAGAVEVRRSNTTFNRLEVTVRDREATLARLLDSRHVVNLEFNSGYFSGATYHGLGYNILNSNVANVRYNDCISTNSRKGLDGRHGKNIVIRGGFYNVINDHYGRNYIIRDVVMSGLSTHIPGYVTPQADLQAWHFRPSRAFGFAGANVHLENVTIDSGAGGIFSARGDIGELYGTIVLKDVTVRGNQGDLLLFSHSIDPDFDFAGEVRSPGRLIIEDVRLENPGRMQLEIGKGFRGGTYGSVNIRKTDPLGNVYSSSRSLTFSESTFSDTRFELEADSLVNFRNCTFGGRSTGLTRNSIGTATGNFKLPGADISFPIDLK